MDKGAWWSVVHRVAKIWTQLKQLGMAQQGIIAIMIIIMLVNLSVDTLS